LVRNDQIDRHNDFIGTASPIDRAMPHAWFAAVYEAGCDHRVGE
jgi:hypothetical protein